ncbi:MAG: putative monovalent cation/H+ antiporter subunit A [candidate division KSB1 bacterium]|nr:putative monovalent cation/H+ antiporter subunit A [candidate division KSB1 bacterium]MDZ7318980.1 putative monovalent cation/H+ antiporter subunit A [candidate division KSB1 bacterium]MDZ7340982.1 putative monovalent cation/H+ antiporter subunit A [candidate division KSB1 bacterium]
MGILISVLSGFVIAAFVPLFYKFAKAKIGWVIAMVPLGALVYFFSYVPQICREDCQPLVFTYRWIPSLGINLSFYLDGLSLLFALLISGIGALIMIYAGGYLKDHAAVHKFYIYILLFMSSMLGVVLANNMICLFIFWELTSFSSYMLIGFYHEKEASRWAALQALLVTGLGGLALLAGVLLIGSAGDTYELSHFLSNKINLNDHPLYLPMLLLMLLAAFTKSAQVPFHFWLPGAMEAPAPVSSYLHSATMVKAGIYLLARFNPILGDTMAWHYLITLAGAATMLVGALLALPQTDLKKLLAYTTVSALGTLVMLLGLETQPAAEAAIIFLLVHSLYKGSLFMVAGSIDHETGTRQTTKLSGLLKYMPFTAVAAFLAACSMSGFPPLLGFIGKELLYEAKIQAPSAAWVITLTGIIANAVNVTVAIVVGMRPFIGKRIETPQLPHEPPLSMVIGPAVLSLLGLILGLFPWLISKSIVSSAVSAIRAQYAIIHLQNWHGINVVFLLSVFTIAVGIAFVGIRRWFQLTVSKLPSGKSLTPTVLFKQSLDNLLKFAGLQTRFLQSGYQRDYLITVIIFAVGLMLWQLVRAGNIDLALHFSDLKFFEIAVVLLMAMATLMAIFTSSRIAAIAALGVIGYGIALIYVMYGAPDLALTQLVVETLTVVLFMLVVYHLPVFKRLSPSRHRLRDALIAVLAGTIMTTMVLIAQKIQLQPSISSYFAEKSVAIAHGRNIVNVILVDFRAIDTLGEITVLATAAIGIYAMLKLTIPRKKE